MISKRKDPDVLTRSKPILDAPVYPDYPVNTPEGRSPVDDPELLRNSDHDDNEITNEVKDEEADNLDEDKADWDR